MVDMHPQGSRMRIEFLIPARGLFGYKSEFLTVTRARIMSHVFSDYQPYKGDIERRNTGSLVSFETGEAVTYTVFTTLGRRGRLFVRSRYSRI